MSFLGQKLKKPETASCIQPFNVTPVATRSAISVDLSGAYWLTFISSLWKVRLTLTIYRTAKMEWLCQPWLEGQGLTLSRLQGCTQKAWQETTTVARTSGNNALNKCTWSSHNTITSVFSDICLVRTWLQTACSIYIFSKRGIHI